LNKPTFFRLQDKVKNEQSMTRIKIEQIIAGAPPVQGNNKNK
jgi:hypothetical protein